MLEQIDFEKKLNAKLTSGRTGQMKSYNAILLVSIGKENFEKEAIKSAIKMISLEFKSCSIVVADTLQRFNIATEKQISIGQAYQEALIEGENWLKRYKFFFEKELTIPYEIIRWDDLINALGFKEKESEFDSFLARNPILSESMFQSIKEYGKRLVKHLGESHFHQISSQHEENCYSYLKEECVAITFLPKIIAINNDKTTPSVIVYPGKATSILTTNREIFIKDEFRNEIDNHIDFLNWLSYRFVRVKEKSNTNLSKKEDDSVIKKIEHINFLSEEQLSSFGFIFDDLLLKEFKEYLLEALFSDDFIFRKSMINCGKFFDVKSIAYIFATQLNSMFKTLEKKQANKCKGHIIKILKKESISVVNEALALVCSVQNAN